MFINYYPFDIFSEVGYKESAVVLEPGRGDVEDPPRSDYCFHPLLSGCRTLERVTKRSSSSAHVALVGARRSC